MKLITGVQIKTRYTVWCYGADGKLKWKEVFENLVVTLGLNALLDNTFDNAAAAFAFFVGLKDTGTPVLADTMASHASWATITPYSDANDPAFTKDGIASGGAMTNAASKAVFNINATDVIFGAFLKDNNTKGGATGFLYGVGDFSTSRSVISGDTLNVQVDLTITSS